METKTLAILVAATMSAVGILGDYFLKRASEASQPLATRSFVLGFVLYASTAVAWTFVMRHLTLATIGVIYAMCMILLLALMGVMVFNEPLHRSESWVLSSPYRSGLAGAVRMSAGCLTDAFEIEESAWRTFSAMPRRRAVNRLSKLLS